MIMEGIKEGLGFLGTIVNIIAESAGASAEQLKELAVKSDEAYEKMRSVVFRVVRTSDELMAFNMKRAEAKAATGVLPPAMSTTRAPATFVEPAFDVSDEPTDPGKKPA
jgi:hypothetical protein